MHFYVKPERCYLGWCAISMDDVHVNVIILQLVVQLLGSLFGLQKDENWRFHALWQNQTKSYQHQVNEGTSWQGATPARSHSPYLLHKLPNGQ